MKKKTIIWILIPAFLIILISLGIMKENAVSCEFPIDGDTVSDLDAEYVAKRIAEIKHLDDGSQLCVNEDGFDLMFTPDFRWANDGAIRFFYTRNHKTHTAQLRMFHDDNKYFVTDSSEWPEQRQSFKLIHYLNALKCMPQEEILKLSPDADGYSVYMRNSGDPDDYARVLKYSQHGIEETEGWHIHLEILPLHKDTSSGYTGSGDEVIHIFYYQQS